jgi:hypothetical protein
MAEGLNNVDDVLVSFATSCYEAGLNCTLNAFPPNALLNFTSPEALLSAIDITLDNLYAKPVPIYSLPTPAVATVSNFRRLLFSAMYNIGKWPALAEHLAAAFNGNFTGIVNATMQKVDAVNLQRSDSSRWANSVIFVCSSYVLTHRVLTDV